MPVSDTVAIQFAAEGEAATINYSIPMPGAHTGRRITEIDLDLGANYGEFTDSARQLGRLPADLVGATKSGSVLKIDDSTAKNFYALQLPTAAASTRVAERIGDKIPTQRLASEDAGPSAAVITEAVTARTGLVEDAVKRLETG